MERVTGIRGVFFRATDPKGLAEWYERHLGGVEVWLGAPPVRAEEAVGAVPGHEDADHLHFAVGDAGERLERWEGEAVAVVRRA